MTQKLFISSNGAITKGLEQFYLPFNIDNDAFPTLWNFYMWRGRVKRKRGTIPLDRLRRQVQYGSSTWQYPAFSLSSGAGNLLTSIGVSLTIGASIVPGTVAVIVSSVTYSDYWEDGTLNPGVVITGASQAVQCVLTANNSFSMGDYVYVTGVVGMTQLNGNVYQVVSANSTTITLNVNSSMFGMYSSGGIATDISVTAGTINYTTAAITITGGGSGSVTGSFSYFPGLPGMGLEDLNIAGTQYPVLLAFDTTYAYQVGTANSTAMTPATFYTVSYYKSTNNPVVWTGANYQQFWSTNYLGAFWATNGTPGFRFAKVHSISNQMGTTITMVLNTYNGSGALTTLILNDQLWFNEGAASGAMAAYTLPGNLGYISMVYNQTATPGKYDVTFVASQTVTGYTNDTGIAQTLTSDAVGTGTGDGIRWYDGDMTSGTGIPTSTTTGWVNFAPPLTAGTVDIDDEPAELYYLVGATAIVPFKDRLLFFGVYVQTSSGAAPIFLNDVALWSWNGTCYYNALVPTPANFNGTYGYDVAACYVDTTGKGGHLSAGIDQTINTVNNNEDVLLVGFTNRQTRFVYTGNDIQPFLFYSINVEYGSSATFSSVTMDRGALTFGVYGFALTTQTGAQRVDLSIPTQIFSQKQETGVFANQRISAARDYYHEWAYFTFVPDSSPWNFPTQTFQFNYRENAWSINYENFTTQGLYRPVSAYTWATLPFATWNTWNETWQSSSLTAEFPNVVAATPQGYVVIKGQGSGEAPTGYVAAISQTSSGGLTQITSYNHCVEEGDYLLFTQALGTVTGTISGITQAMQAVISCSASFSVGSYIYISEVEGMTQINSQFLQVVSVTGPVLGVYSITVNLNTSIGYGAYSSGGVCTISPLNQQIGKVSGAPTTNTFAVDIPYQNLGYIGMGQFTRLIQPFLQTKQFPIYWNEGRKVRIGAQKYLFDTTANGQCTLLIYLSQDYTTPWNNSDFPITAQIVPSDESTNNSLLYSTIIYTCPESSDIGLNMYTESLVNPDPISSSQAQIWHRINTSLIGDTFQIGLSLNDSQMRNLTYATAEITLHSMQIDLGRGPYLA